MKIRELLTDESKWTKGSSARYDNNFVCLPASEDAVKWCLMGALVKCYSYTPESYTIQEKMRNYTIKTKGFYNIVYFNDHGSTKFEDIKTLIDALDI